MQTEHGENYAPCLLLLLSKNAQNNNANEKWQKVNLLCHRKQKNVSDGAIVFYSFLIPKREIW